MTRQVRDVLHRGERGQRQPGGKAGGKNAWRGWYHLQERVTGEGWLAGKQAPTEILLVPLVLVFFFLLFQDPL